MMIRKVQEFPDHLFPCCSTLPVNLTRTDLRMEIVTLFIQSVHHDSLPLLCYSAGLCSLVLDGHSFPSYSALKEPSIQVFL